MRTLNGTTMEIKHRTKVGISMLRRFLAATIVCVTIASPALADPMKPFGANDSSNFQFPEPVRPSQYHGRLVDSSGSPLSAAEDHYVRWRVSSMYRGFGYPMGPFSRWTGNTVNQLGQLCIKIGINCNWLMALPSDVGSIVSMSPDQLMNLSGNVEDVMRGSAGLDSRLLEVLRRESEEYRRRLASMNEAQRRQFIKEYGKPQP